MCSLNNHRDLQNKTKPLLLLWKYTVEKLDDFAFFFQNYSMDKWSETKYFAFKSLILQGWGMAERADLFLRQNLGRWTWATVHPRKHIPNPNAKPEWMLTLYRSLCSCLIATLECVKVKSLSIKPEWKHGSYQFIHFPLFFISSLTWHGIPGLKGLPGNLLLYRWLGRMTSQCK